MKSDIAYAESCIALVKSMIVIVILMIARVKFRFACAQFMVAGVECLIVVSGVDKAAENLICAAENFDCGRVICRYNPRARFNLTSPRRVVLQSPRSSLKEPNRL